MIQPLTANRRRTMVRCSLTLCVVSLLLLALAVPPRSAAGAAPKDDGVRGLPALPPPLTYPKLSVLHNPFARPAPAIADDGDALPPDFVLPPNDGIASLPRVQALVVGTVPKALVEIDGHGAIVGIGTKLEGSTIVGIDSGGIVLENGERLPFEGRRP